MSPETHIRPLHPGDLPIIERLLDTSDDVYLRFDPWELPGILTRLPTVGALSAPPGPLGRITGESLQAFLLVHWLTPPSAWIGGFGVARGQGRAFEEWLERLLPLIEPSAWRMGARTLYYSGGDRERDWLRPWFERHGFSLITLLRSYDKLDIAIPLEGIQNIHVRPFAPEDVGAIIAVEEEAFGAPWRHDAASFLQIAEMYPYFVVAEDETGVIGYQFNAVEGATGYLVRIAVHPRAQGRGVGTRLLAEAIRYFARQHVTRILLNAEEANTGAHRLYERFGFQQVEPGGFVLGRAIALGAEPKM